MGPAIMPMIAPTGVLRLPMVVANALSSSANHTVATLEMPFCRKD